MKKENTMKHNNTPWFTTRQTAEYLNLSERTIKTHLALGSLKRRKVGRKNMIHLSWIEQFVLSNASGKLSKIDKQELQFLRMA